jgi:replicative DNA helicase
VLFRSRTLAACIEAGVDDSWFTDSVNCKLFETATKLHLSGRNLDSVIINTASGLPAQLVNGKADSCQTPEYYGHYLALVRAARMARRADLLTQECTELIKGISDDETAQSVLADIQGRWADIVEGVADDDSRNLADIGIELVNSWEVANPKHEVSWPIHQFNDLVGPLTDELVYIIAPPSCGKSAFVLQWELFLGIGGTMSSLASLESKKPKVVGRLIAQASYDRCRKTLNTFNLRRRKFVTDNDYETGRKASEELRGLPIRIKAKGM